MGKTIIGGYIGLEAPVATEAFYPIAGGMAAHTAELLLTCPIGKFTEGTDFRLERIAVHVEANALAASATFHLRIDGVDAAAEVVVPAGQTGWFYSDPLDAEEWPATEAHDVVIRLERPASGYLRVGSIYALTELTDSDHGLVIVSGFPETGTGEIDPDPYEVRPAGYWEDQPTDGPTVGRKRHKFGHGGTVIGFHVTSHGDNEKLNDVTVAVAFGGTASASSIDIPTTATGNTAYTNDTDQIPFSAGDELGVTQDDGVAPGTGAHRVSRWFILVETEGADFDLAMGARTNDGTFYLWPGDNERTTSVTSVTIGTGVKEFALDDTGMAYFVGDRVRVSDAGDKTNFVEGVVTDYTNPDLTLLVDLIGGSGTFTSWNVNRTVTARGAIGTDSPTGRTVARNAFSSGDLAVLYRGFTVNNADPVGPFTSSEVLWSQTADRTIVIPDDVAGGWVYAFADTAFTGASVMTLEVNSTPVAEFAFGVGDGEAVVTFLSGPITIAPGDVVEIVADATADATGGDIDFDLYGYEMLDPDTMTFPVMMDCQATSLRSDWIFYGYDVGVNDLPWYMRTMLNGSPAGPRIDIDTPVTLGDWYGEGFAEDTSTPLELVDGDLVHLELGLQFPEDSDGTTGAEGYPVAMAVTFSAPAAPAAPPRDPIININ